MLVALSGCDARREVVIQVELPDLEDTPTPVSGLPIVILPYDRDSLLGVLEAEAETPRPHVALLDSLFGAFQEPYVAFATAAAKMDRYRDTLTVLKATLDTLPRESEPYRNGFQQFAVHSDSLEQAEREREAATRALERARTSFVPLSDSLRAEVRLWEAQTFAGYDTLVKNLVDETGRFGVSDTTDALGEAHVTLGRGPWWIYARAWNIRDPNSEWYWNVLVESDTVVLTSRNGSWLPTY